MGLALESAGPLHRRARCRKEGYMGQVLVDLVASF
jgi:hypothetical protein